MSEFPSGAAANNIEKQAEPEPEMVSRYVEYAKKEQEKVEVLELTENKAVRIKLKGQEEVIFKSPEELFYLGGSADDKNEKDRKDIREHYGGMDRPLFVDLSLRYEECISEECKITLKRDIDTVYAVAPGIVGLSELAYFLRLSSFKKDIAQFDEKVQEIADGEISEKLRIFYLSERLIYTPNEEVFSLIEDIYKENPSLISEVLDYTIRTCLGSGHNQSNGLFRFLIARPELIESLTNVHRDFSLPFLLERDLYGMMIWNSDEGYSDRPKEYNKYKMLIQEVIDNFHIDIEAIRKRLAESGNPREFMSEF
jgi:hypothetical protein